MHRLLVWLCFFTSVCVARPTWWWKRLVFTNPIGIGIPSGPVIVFDPPPITPTPSPTTTPTSSDPSTAPYEIFAIGNGNCKQGFIGKINAAACWTSTCGAWKELRIRRIYNATITMYSTNACTGPAENIMPQCFPNNIEQDCAFASSSFRSFRVTPGCASGVQDSNAICSNGLKTIDCSGSGGCMGTNS